MHKPKFNSHTSFQIEQLAFGSDWPVEMLQLSAGPLIHQFTTIDLGQVLLEYIGCAAAVQVRDVHRSPYFSFGFVTGGNSEPKFMGHPMEAGDAIIWRPNDVFEYEYVTPTNLTGFIIRVEQELAERRGWAQSLPRLMKPSTAGYQTLKAMCDGIFLDRTRDIPFTGLQLIDGIELAFGSRIFLEQDTETIDESAGVVRIVSHARDYLSGPWQEEFENIAELSKAIGVHRRVLYRAFRQWLGIGPARYSRVLRLAAVRKELLASTMNQATVMQTALDHGFFHAGRFAGEYREFFGETPSQTLQKR